jgi:hypothetical protein
VGVPARIAIHRYSRPISVAQMPNTSLERAREE